MTARTTNIVYELDPGLVKEEIANKIKYYEELMAYQIEQAQKAWEVYKQCKRDGTVSKNFSREPTTAEFEKTLYNEWIDQEINYYATVRVVELPTRRKKRFILVYGDTDNMTVKQSGGTGPFESLDRAADWYLKGGR